MLSVFTKEVNAFFSSLIAYLVIAVFLVMNGLFMWVFTESSVLDYNYATMDSLFALAPFILLFLIPAITMKSFSEERQRGTLEFLLTKPLSETDVILGKYFANLSLVLFALLPTLIYYFSVYQLGSPKGNLDSGAIFGSYIGLVFLSASFVAIGMLASAITENQIVAFILAAFLCFVLHWSFNYIAQMPVFIGNLDSFIDSLGIASHYDAMSKGAIDTRDLVYFFSVIILFLSLTHTIISSKK
jgi:ABC-2 type transport system permease protein